MSFELKPEKFKDGLRFVEDPVEDLFIKFDLTEEKPQHIKAYMNDGGILVLWKDDTAVMKVKKETDAIELLKSIPKDSKCTFLVDNEFSSLVKRRFDRREEKYFINYATKESLKPVKDKKYEIVPLSVDKAPEIAKIWPFAKHRVDFVRDFINRFPAYTILENGNPTAWGSVLLESEKGDLTGMWYTRRKYRNQGRMKHIVSKMAEDITGEGKFLRADIRVNNYPSLGVAKSLGFLQGKTYSRLEPI